MLARLQGQRTDLWRDEESGKVLHELRVGELARMGAIPYTPYYGTVDATPLFLILLAEYSRWQGDLDLFHELRKPVDAALRWIRRPCLNSFVERVEFDRLRVGSAHVDLLFARTENEGLTVEVKHVEGELDVHVESARAP